MDRLFYIIIISFIVGLLSLYMVKDKIKDFKSQQEPLKTVLKIMIIYQIFITLWLLMVIVKVLQLNT